MVRNDRLFGTLSRIAVAGAASVLALGPMPAFAADSRIALGEVTVPHRAALDVDAVRTTAQSELLRIDTSKLPRSRNLVVSLAVVAVADDSAASVDATLSDGVTGSMIAVLEGRARTNGTASREERAELVRVAVRSAVRQIPQALPRK